MDQNNQFNQEPNEQNDQSNATDSFFQSGDFAYNPEPVQPINMPRESNNYAVASLILGIISVVLCCCCPPAIIVTAALAIVFAIIARKKEGRMNGQAIGGLICGIVSLVLSLLVVAAYVLSMITMSAEDRTIFYESFYDAFYDAYEDYEEEPLDPDDGDEQLTPDDNEQGQLSAEDAAALAAATPVIEKIRALAQWPVVTANNYNTLKSEYEAAVAAYDKLDKAAKTIVGSENVQILNSAKASLRAYANSLKGENAEAEYQDMIAGRPANRIVKATVKIDGVIDEVVQKKSTPLTLNNELCNEWNNDIDLKSVGAGVVGDVRLTEDADTNVSFYFAYDNEYLYVTEVRSDRSWAFTAYDFRKPFAGDGSLLWFTRGSNSSQPLCGIQWSAGLRASSVQSTPKPGNTTPALGLFYQDMQLTSKKMSADVWERAIAWDSANASYVLEAKIPLSDLGFTAQDIESGIIGATFCTVDIVNTSFDGNSNKLWTGYGYQMQYPGVNSWYSCYRFLAVK